MLPEASYFFSLNLNLLPTSSIISSPTTHHRPPTIVYHPYLTTSNIITQQHYHRMKVSYIGYLAINVICASKEQTNAQLSTAPIRRLIRGKSSDTTDDISNEQAFGVDSLSEVSMSMPSSNPSHHMTTTTTTTGTTIVPANEQVEASYNVYFGYLHSHTGISDGSGTPARHMPWPSGLDSTFLALPNTATIPMI